MNFRSNQEADRFARTPGHNAALPAGNLQMELDPQRNFGAEIL